jgi:WD40 repeat protein
MQDGAISLSWSPDGHLLAIAPEFWDPVVWIWDAGTGAGLAALEGHTDHVKTVAWSPDGSRLAMGGADGTVRVWGLMSGSK